MMTFDSICVSFAEAFIAIWLTFNCNHMKMLLVKAQEDKVQEVLKQVTSDKLLQFEYGITLQITGQQLVSLVRHETEESGTFDSYRPIILFSKEL